MANSAENGRDAGGTERSRRLSAILLAACFASYLAYMADSVAVRHVVVEAGRLFAKFVP